MNREDAFERAVVPHLDAAYTLARYLLADEDEARDAVHDAFVRALKYFDPARVRDSRPWLLMIVRHACYARRATVTEILEYDDSRHSPETDDPTDDSPSFLFGVTPDALRSAVDALPAEFREVLILRELHECTYGEIASVVGAPIGTVMSRLSRARSRLRAALSTLASVPGV